MKNALEMNKIANEVNDELNNRLNERANKVIEEVIEPMIEYEAKHGAFSTTCHIGTGVSLDRVVDILKENGYSVSTKPGRGLDIEWFDWNIE